MISAVLIMRGMKTLCLYLGFDLTIPLKTSLPKRVIEKVDACVNASWSPAPHDGVQLSRGVVGGASWSARCMRVNIGAGGSRPCAARGGITGSEVGTLESVIFGDKPLIDHYVACSLQTLSINTPPYPIRRCE